jgi:hypothetical protein
MKLRKLSSNNNSNSFKLLSIKMQINILINNLYNSSSSNLIITGINKIITIISNHMINLINSNTMINKNINNNQYNKNNLLIQV